MKYRVVKSGKTGKFIVERKGWFGWSPAIVHPSEWVDPPVQYATAEEAKADMKRLFQTPDEVVWESA